MNKIIALTVMLLVLTWTPSCANGDSLLDKIDSKIKETAQTASSLCITNDSCYKNFFDINNYCCTLQCCNWFSYVFNNNNSWENFKTTFQSPRPINIIILVAILIVISLLISALLSIISFFLCGCSGICCCCGSRKYSIVSRG